MLQYLSDAVELPHRLLGLWRLLSEANQGRMLSCGMRCVVSVSALELPARHTHVPDLPRGGIFFEMVHRRVLLVGEGRAYAGVVDLSRDRSRYLIVRHRARESEWHDSLRLLRTLLR